MATDIPRHSVRHAIQKRLLGFAFMVRISLGYDCRHEEEIMKRPSRREFLKTAAAGGVAAASLPTILDAQVPDLLKPTVPPSDRLQIALIGAGGQGMSDTRWALRVPGIELTAVADVYDGRLTRSKELWGQQLFTTRDYREVLARPDVDAVIIATPDHWHARIASRRDEGRQGRLRREADGAEDRGRAAAWHRSRATDQPHPAGRQPARQLDRLREGAGAVRAGAIGELNLVEAWINRNSALGAWQYTIPPDASPQTIDWDRFLGNAPKRPFEPVRLFRWRNYRDYGTGIPGDLFVHLFTGIHYVLDCDRADARDGQRRPALLERRPRRARRDARAVRLSEDGDASGVHARR